MRREAIVGALRALTTAAVITASLASNALAAGDPAHGKAVFGICSGCHALSGPSFAAPPLGGVYGRKAGTAAGFQYSKAMVAYGKVWDEESLDPFLASPATAVPGTSMPVGLDAAQDRADVIAYLKSVPAAR